MTGFHCQRSERGFILRIRRETNECRINLHDRSTFILFRHFGLLFIFIFIVEREREQYWNILFKLVLLIRHKSGPINLETKWTG